MAPILGVISYGCMASADTGKNEVCETLTHCEYILKEHSPLEYDYSVLAQGFDSFGLAGEQSLVDRITEPRSKYSERGIELLRRSDNRPSSQNLKTILKFWQTGQFSLQNDTSLIAYLTRYPTPSVYRAALDTLNQANPVLARQSREILEQLPADNTVYPYQPSDLSKLSNVIKSNPNEHIIRHISAIKTPRAHDVLRTSFSGGHEASLNTAYQALYDHDRQAAFGGLLQTLRALKPNDYASAKAISALIRNRNNQRSDNFYLKFAADLMADEQMSIMGRVAGLDALILTQQTLPITSAKASVYTRGVQIYSGSEIPKSYFEAFSQLKKTEQEQSLMTLAEIAGSNPVSRLRLLGVIESYGMSPEARRIISSELRKQDDYRVLEKALKVAAMNMTPTDHTMFQTSALKIESRTPLLGVTASTAALRHLVSMPNISREKRADAYNGFRENFIRRKIDEQKRCEMTPLDMKAQAKQMPYFPQVNLEDGPRSLRVWLATAARFPSGWLAGYELPELQTAMIAYDYDTETGIEIGAGQILGSIFAIVPRSNTGTSFWIITQSEKVTRIYKLENVNQKPYQNIQLTSYRTLPATIESVAIGPQNEWLMAFEGPQPPLLLSRNGMLSAPCNAQNNLRSTSSQGALR